MYLFNSISVISGRWEVDNERPYATEPHFTVSTISASDRNRTWTANIEIKLKKENVWNCSGRGCGRAMVLGNFKCRGFLLIWILVGLGPTVLAVGAHGFGWTFFLSTIIFLLFPSLWSTARYRLKYGLKEPWNPKQLTNEIILTNTIMFVHLYHALSPQYTLGPDCIRLEYPLKGILVVYHGDLVRKWK